MPELIHLEKQFLDTLAALGPGLDKVVVVGGWCPYLYAKHLWKRKIANIPTTLDIDLGVTETGPSRYVQTVYARLKAEGLESQRLFADENEPIEFISRRGVSALKLEFITSFLTSDDTLNRFLGRELACNRIEAFEVLLESPIRLMIEHAGRGLCVRVPEPATFLFHKGVSFVLRGEEFKRDKDFFYIYFILRYAPDREDLLKRLNPFRQHEYFPNFRQNLADFLGDYDKPGYRIIRRFLDQSADQRTVYKQVKDEFAGLLAWLDQPSGPPENA